MPSECPAVTLSGAWKAAWRCWFSAHGRHAMTDSRVGRAWGPCLTCFGEASLLPRMAQSSLWIWMRQPRSMAIFTGATMDPRGRYGARCSWR